MTKIGNGDLPSLRSREGPGVSMYETKEPNKVGPQSQPTKGSSPKANSLWKKCV